MKKKNERIKNNFISYDDFMSLEDDSCVKVNGTYFHFLVAKAQLLNIKSRNYWEILYKYLEIEKINFQVTGNKGVPSYILMSVSDIRYLVNYVMDVPAFRNAFLKSDINAQELNSSINAIKKKFGNVKTETTINNSDETNILSFKAQIS